MTIPWTRIEALSDPVQLQSFECSRDDVTVWLKDKAWNSRHLVATHVCLDDAGGLRAFFSLKTVVISTDVLSGTQASGAIDGQVVGIMLCWMAVHVDDEGNGHGKDLLRAAMAMAVEAHERSPVQLMVVDAAGPELVAYYERAGFKRVGDTLRLVAPMRSVKRALE